MRRIIFILTIVLASALLSSCQKERTWVYYDETACIDKWGVASIPDEKKVKNVKKLLKSTGIHVITVEITNDGVFNPCMACSCTTGKRIKCEIYERDLDKAFEENFYQ